MLKNKLTYKFIPILLIVSILFTACDVPDISEFTALSAEMTRGIRTGVKNTGELLNSASNREDLFKGRTRERFKKEEKNFQRVMKPTLDTLDSLDGYLEALNALSKANKKAGENSKAVVDAVGNLVTAASGITLATTAINIASGILAAGEKFRTARSFKKRVEAAEELVEGRYKPIIDPETNKEVGRVKLCTDDAKNKIEDATVGLAGNIKSIVDGRIDSIASADDMGKIVLALFDDETDEILKTLSTTYKDSVINDLSERRKNEYSKLTKQAERDDFLAVELRERKSDTEEAVDNWKTGAAADLTNVLNSWKLLVKKRALADNILLLSKTGLLTDSNKQAIKDARKASDDSVDRFGCGVIDLLKFTLEDLKIINSRVLSLMIRNSADKNNIILGLHNGIVDNDNRIQSELRFILVFKDLVASLKEKDPNAPPPLDAMKRLRQTLSSIFILDGPLHKTVTASLTGCACGEMKTFLTANLDSSFHASVDNNEWNLATGTIEADLKAGAVSLFSENQKFLAELDRIKPAHKVATDEIAGFEDKQNQMNKLLDASIVALDKWAATHANLRVTLNTKKTLTPSGLKSSVKEILAIIDPPEQTE